MNPTSFFAVFLAGAVLAADARTWTDTQGRTVEAEIVKVNPDQSVVLKTAGGKVVTLPFATFVAEDIGFLESYRALPFTPHPVPWQTMNELFGLPVWQDPSLWDDPAAAAAERMALQKESKTDFMENHRAYPLGKSAVLGEPVFTSVLYGGSDSVDSLAFVFLNQGDLPPISGIASPGTIKEMAAKIESSGMRVHDVLEKALGKPKRDSLGKETLREKVYRWDWNNHAIMLSLQEGKYAALRIMPSDRADRAGRVDKIASGELKKRMAACVERRENGDVVVRNIPMIDQGPKGYCVPATWERYLRYMDIPADMYLLALAGNTGIGGGTYLHEMVAATDSLISANGRELKSIGRSPSLEAVAPYIDQGLPVMWTFLSTPSFQEAANLNTAARNGKTTKKKKNASGQAEDTSSGGHICLVIGYNEQTGEIAISDSWGPQFAERWVPAHTAQNLQSGDMQIIRW